MGQKETDSNNSKLAFMELPIVALFLAFSAGAMDGYAFFTTNMFATFQTGNVVLAAYNLGSFGWSSMLPMAYSLLAFGLGAVFISYLRNFYIRRVAIWTFKTLALEILILLILLLNNVHGFFTPNMFVYIMSFVAGVQGNAFHKLAKMLYANIAVTLDVQLIFGFLADGIMLKKERLDLFKKAASYLIIFLGFAVGASISAVLTDYLGSFTLFVPILSLFIVFVSGKLVFKDGKRMIDLPLED